MTARPMFSIERLMIWICTISVSFAAGMYVGEVKSAAELKPCPQAARGELYKSDHGTRQVCTYVELIKDKRKYSLRPVVM